MRDFRAGANRQQFEDIWRRIDPILIIIYYMLLILFFRTYDILVGLILAKE